MGLEDALLVWLGIGFIVVFGGGTYAAAHLGSWMAGIDAPPAHPIDLIAGLIKGRVPWPVQSTVAAGVMAGLILALTIVVLVAWTKGASTATPTSPSPPANPGPAAPGRRARNASSTSPTSRSSTAAAPWSWPPAHRPHWFGPCPGTRDHTRRPWRSPSRPTAHAQRKNQYR